MPEIHRGLSATTHIQYTKRERCPRPYLPMHSMARPCGDVGVGKAEKVLQTCRDLLAATLCAMGEGEKEDVQRPACYHVTLAGCRCHRVVACHTARTKEATLGSSRRSYDQPTVGATTVYKYVGGQVGKKEKQNS